MKKYINHEHYQGYDRRGDMANGNGSWVTKWLVGAIWGILILWAGSLTSNLSIVDKDSRSRDIAEASQRECLNVEVVRIDTNQKAVMTKLDEVVKQVVCIAKDQAVMVNNQDTIISTLKEMKRDIK